MRMATLQIKDFPDDLHRRLRVAAAERDMTLRDLVARVVEVGLPQFEQGAPKP
jgi:plasmid stability protein